jgi:hypothetical protein
MCTIDEVSGMLVGKLCEYIDCIEDGETLGGACDIALSVWEAESADGVVFYRNYTAELFAMRHNEWVRDALVHTIDAYGGDCVQALQTYAECVDRFLVPVFIEATRHYLAEQIGLDYSTEYTGKDLKERRELIMETTYDGKF